MKNSQLPLLLTCLLLLGSIPVITSCFDYNDKKSDTPAALPGKWQLQRIENNYITEVPPTDVIKLELEFNLTSWQTNRHNTEVQVNGNILAGGFTGRAAYSGRDTAGALEVGPLNVTEDVLLARYRQFDAHYLQELASAKMYCIVNDKLIIETKGGSELVYTRTGAN